MSSLLLIVTGSVAAIKAPKLCELLLKGDIAVDVILTKSALEFVKEEDFRKLGVQNVFSDLFDAEMEEKIGHIELSRRNDLVFIYPASANFMAKITAGLADDLASTAVLASDKRIFLAPAMNVEMWHNKIVQENVVKLEARQIEVIYPEKGELACGEVGEGRVKEPEDVVNMISGYFSLRDKLKGKKILITAGGTVEKIDPVRFIGNFSSGKQGVAIAKKFSEYGADVTLVIGSVNCRLPSSLKVISAMSADQMRKAVLNELEESQYDIGVFTAAVADFKVLNQSDKKIKKEEIEDFSIKLTKNPDILKEVSVSKVRPKLLVGFAAETNNLKDNALKKLNRKNCDYIVANDVSSGQVFAQDNNKVILFSKTKQSESSGTKEQVADFLIKQII